MGVSKGNQARTKPRTDEGGRGELLKACMVQHGYSYLRPYGTYAGVLGTVGWRAE